MRIHAVAAATGLALSLAGCGASLGSHRVAPGLHVVSSISDRATLVGALTWMAVPAGVHSDDPVERVDFLVDGRRRWSDRRAPFVFNDDHNVLHSWLLTRGSHRLAVRLVTRLGATASTASQVTVAPATAIPSGLTGRWTRRLTASDIPLGARPTLLPGVWHARFAHDGVLYFSGPHGSGGVEAFTAIGTRLIALAGPVLWIAPGPRRAGLCRAEGLAPYAWRVVGSALILASSHDGRCPNRAALFADIWTRRQPGHSRETRATSDR